MFYSIWEPQVARRRRPTCHRKPSASASRSSSSCTVWDDLRHLALPEVRRAPGAVQGRRETLYGAAQVGHRSSTKPRPATPRTGEARTRRAGGARAHRDRHAGVPGRGDGPERRARGAGRRGPARGAAQHRPTAAGGARRRRTDRALPGAAPARRPRLQPQRAAVRWRGARGSTSPRAARAPRCCPNSGPNQAISC